VGGSHDWSAAVEGYRLISKDRPRKQGGRVVLYGREQLECMELCMRVGDESLWVRTKVQTNTGDFVVGVYYGLPDQEE